MHRNKINFKNILNQYFYSNYTGIRSYFYRKKCIIFATATFVRKAPYYSSPGVVSNNKIRKRNYKKTAIHHFNLE